MTLIVASPNSPTIEATQVSSAGLLWRLTRAGSGPPLLLLHGTGSSSHTWRDLLPILAQHFTVLAPDLPGHGATTTPQRLTLPSMATAVTHLLRTLDMQPVMAVGHSAGAAIALRMTLDRTLTPQLLASLNGALLPLAGARGWLFSTLAKALARRTLVARLVSRRAADPSVIQRLLAGTGSTLDARGVAAYQKLARQPSHVAAALGMMANWNLNPIAYQLPTLSVPLTLLTGERDLTIPPCEAEYIQTLLPQARRVSLGPLGHLAHEEQPDRVAGLLLQLAREARVIP